MQNIYVFKPRLEKVLVEGQVVNRQWLYDQGFSRPDIDFFLRSSKLESIARGVYRRPGPALKWEHILYSLIKLGYSVHVGGRSALELQGFAHYLPFSENRAVEFYTTSKLPSWVTQLQEIPIIVHKVHCFEGISQEMLTTRVFGHWDWELQMASVELALFELLCQVKSEADFLLLDKFFESMTTLRPNLLNNLLLSCTQVKAKRLFFWFMDRHNHPWQAKIERDVALGSGKRMIVKGGILDKTYQITVPKEMGENDDFF